MSTYDAVATYERVSEDEIRRDTSLTADRFSEQLRRTWYDINKRIRTWTKPISRRVWSCLMIALVVVAVTLALTFSASQASLLMTSKYSSRQGAYSHHIEEDRTWPRPSVIQPLQELCSSKTWHEGLYFTSYNRFVILSFRGREDANAV